MTLRLLYSIVIGLAIGGAAIAQDAPPASSNGQNAGPGSGNSSAQRGGRGRMGGGAGMMGRGVQGTVTETAADHFTIKTYTGEIYSIHYSANTRFLKQPPAPAAQSGSQDQAQPQGAGQNQGQGQGRAQGDFRRGVAGAGRGMNMAQQIKSSDIKTGDAIAATGEIDAAAKSVGAVMIMQIDPARAKQMEQLEANYGKTWLQGKVTAIDETKVTIMGTVDNAPHTFLADENTTFRKQRDPVTLADIQVGDTVRVEGATNNGAFTATTVNVMGAPADMANPASRRPRPE